MLSQPPYTLPLPSFLLLVSARSLKRWSMHLRQEADLALGNFKRRCNWFLALVIGSWTEAIGLVLRIILRTNPHSTGVSCAIANMTNEILG